METPVFRHMEADYLDVGTADAPDIQIMRTFESIGENYNAQTVERHYTNYKSASIITTGYQTQFPITGDMYKNNKVMEYLRDIGDEQKLGVETDFIRVRLYEPIGEEPNTFYARRFRVAVEMSGKGGAGGEIVPLSGNLNAQRDVEIGTFNTQTKTFTPAVTV